MEGAAGEDHVCMGNVEDPLAQPRSPRPEWAQEGVPYGDELLRDGKVDSERVVETIENEPE